MRTWPDKNGSAISRFLRQRRLRHPQTPIFYHRVPRGFQDVVKRSEHSSSRVSRRTLEVWLHERGAEWSASTLLHRAFIIDRFLDFLVHEESIASNPIAELRTKLLREGRRRSCGRFLPRSLTERWKRCGSCPGLGAFLAI